jgi:hypothetical protein
MHLKGAVYLITKNLSWQSNPLCIYLASARELQDKSAA